VKAGISFLSGLVVCSMTVLAQQSPRCAHRRSQICRRHRPQRHLLCRGKARCWRDSLSPEQSHAESWENVARQLIAAGINTLTVDTDPNKTRKQRWPGDLDAAPEFLASQSGVKRDVIGIGGAGVLGVEDSVETARRHPAEVKSLVLLSGETESLDFLRQASQLPELFVAADDDEYPPIVEPMELLYITASSPSRKFVHYSSSHEAPWLWYEPFDIGKVPAGGGHGTDMFKVHPELPGIIVDWFVTTLIKTPGHAPADTVAPGNRAGSPATARFWRLARFRRQRSLLQSTKP